MNNYRKPTLTEIHKTVVAKGGTYQKGNFYLNGNDAYIVNGKIYTKEECIQQFMMGNV